MNAQSVPLVLVIDDDDDVCSLLREVIQAEGFRVQVANSGAEGLDLARKLHPALITLDLGLPGRSGVQVLNDIRNGPRTWDIPVFVLTGYGEEVLGSWAPLPHEYLFHKPLEIGRFKETLHSVLQSFPSL